MYNFEQLTIHVLKLFVWNAICALKNYSS